MVSHIYNFTSQCHSQTSWSGDSQGQETFLATYADKQTDNYDTRVLKPPSLSTKCKINGIEP